ncbi:hypothetical protein CTAM01_12231 [Colletotrichum tamarilloi]|uniref:Uncharacterized protein n=1 Tax=Colletotrichum tamarilloi TaxID=1209934 RepID=A0ABQ9QVE2_9PEZI|nr:uncharacterized protein CTAM01_12231 [Colletotrichum tamarilloi]KAK1486350.1 hypothetical protein CTAM01_12231 [Colletotrichum tamarilloi]
MIKQYFAEVRLLTKDVYIWWFRHNLWVIIPEDSRMGYAMTVHTDLVRECAKMSRVSCQILNGWDRDRESWWTGHTIDYMAARKFRTRKGLLSSSPNGQQTTPNTNNTMAEVNPNQPTTEILFKDIVVRRLATDPQTLQDFFFDRCITTKGQEKLHAEEIMGAVAGPVDDD